MKKVANQKIDMVMKELQAAHQKALGTPYPNTTARAPVVTTRAPSTPAAKTPDNQINNLRLTHRQMVVYLKILVEMRQMVAHKIIQPKKAKKEEDDVHESRVRLWW